MNKSFEQNKSHQDRPFKDRQDRPQKREVELLSIKDYETRLVNHVWYFNTNTYYDLTASMKEERYLFDQANKGGVQYMLLFVKHAKAAIGNGSSDVPETSTKDQSDSISLTIHKAELASMKKTLEESMRQEMLTGDADFDAFRDRVMKHDFFFQFSGDGRQTERGENEHKFLSSIATDRQGIYLSYWNYKCQMAGLEPIEE